MRRSLGRALVGRRPAAAAQPRRYLNLHEFQSKALLARFGVPVQPGRAAMTGVTGRMVAEELLEQDETSEFVVKAQIHAGGRGKGDFTNGFRGGVHMARLPGEVHQLCDAMLGQRLVTKQTGPEGQLCSTVLVHRKVDIASECYFAILQDRARGGPSIVASAKGGVDIEEVARTDPGALVVEAVDVDEGLTEKQAKRIAERIGLGSASLLPQAVKSMRGLYDLFDCMDATQVEVNPLAVSEDGHVYAVDAKLNFDDNAAFRQKELFSLRDKSMEDPRDVAAEEVGLHYIGLDGNIGCMVNGAGLAMSTMDIIHLYGGEPANFLDVGGGASEEQVTEAFELLASDPKVEAILVNIFGGIMHCETIAEGIVHAHHALDLGVPLIVRLEGTNVDEGRRILEESGLPITFAKDLDDAAQKAVAAVNGEVHVDDAA